MQHVLPLWSQLLNLLSCGYLLAPQEHDFRAVSAFFHAEDWPELWPQQDKRALYSLADALMQTPTPRDWQRLFVGPNHLPSPPWGSVWLDPEHVLEGDSTQRLKAFLAEQKMVVEDAAREPVDHIGLMLMQAAFLAGEGRAPALAVLLRQHLLSWLPQFVETLNHAECGFYPALARLTLLTVEEMNQVLPAR